MNLIKPREALIKVVDEIPEDCRGNIVVIGSLAAAYAFFGKNNRIAVRTKDIDCLLRPFEVATEKCEIITRKLLKAGWNHRYMGRFKGPGTAETPEKDLPAVRLYPPDVDPEGGNPWFIEFLTEPKSTKEKGRKWTRMIIENDHYVLPSFRFLSIATFSPKIIEDLDIYYAQPQMMVLANLLEHPEIKPDIMSSKFGNREIKRSNKDLGRVLAIGYLAQSDGLNDFRSWGHEWFEALKYCFPDEWMNIAHDVRKGLIKLIASDQDMNEAYHTCVYGLLSSYGVEEDELKEVGERILGEAVKELERLVDDNS